MNKKSFAAKCLEAHAPSVDGEFVAYIKQYFLPHGQQVTMECDLPESVEPLYLAMLGKGRWLAAEVLRTGEVSLTIEDEEEDYDIEVVPNGPEVTIALLRLLERGYGPKSE